MNGQNSPNVAQQFSAYPGASSIDPEPPSMLDAVSVTTVGIVIPNKSGIEGEVVVVPASDDVAVDAESVMLVVVVVSSGTVVDVASVVTRVVALEVVAGIIVDVVVAVTSVVVDSD